MNWVLAALCALAVEGSWIVSVFRRRRSVSRAVVLYRPEPAPAPPDETYHLGFARALSDASHRMVDVAERYELECERRAQGS